MKEMRQSQSWMEFVTMLASDYKQAREDFSGLAAFEVRPEACKETRQDYFLGPER